MRRFVRPEGQTGAPGAFLGGGVWNYRFCALMAGSNRSTCCRLDARMSLKTSGLVSPYGPMSISLWYPP